MHTTQYRKQSNSEISVAAITQDAVEKRQEKEEASECIEDVQPTIAIKQQSLFMDAAQFPPARHQDTFKMVKRDQLIDKLELQSAKEIDEKTNSMDLESNIGMQKNVSQPTI